MKNDDFHLFSFVNKIELKLPYDTRNNNFNNELNQKSNLKRNKFMKNKKRQLQNNNPNKTLIEEINKAMNSTNNSSNNSTEDIEIVEEYITSDMISKQQLRGNCFLYYNGFFYDLSKIKWAETSRYILYILLII